MAVGDPAVVVVGSINVDTTMEVDRLPAAGETLLARALRTGLGGKGANQAVACRRQGVPTALVGAVGSDSGGADALAVLQGEGLDVSAVRIIEGAPTGAAHIAVDLDGANTVIVFAGANARLSLGEPDRRTVGAAAVVLAQLEVPEDSILGAFRAARTAGGTTILNPAPARPLTAELLGLCSFLIPNEHEAAELTGDADPYGAASTLQARAPAATVIVTLGARGALVLRPGDATADLVGPIAVDAVDSVAAGDAFCGVLAAALAQGRSLHEAVRRAGAGGAHAVTIAGAMRSLPRAADIDRLLVS